MTNGEAGHELLTSGSPGKGSRIRGFGVYIDVRMSCFPKGTVSQEEGERERDY